MRNKEIMRNGQHDHRRNKGGGFRQNRQSHRRVGNRQIRRIEF